MVFSVISLPTNLNVPMPLYSMYALSIFFNSRPCAILGRFLCSCAVIPFCSFVIRAFTHVHAPHVFSCAMLTHFLFRCPCPFTFPCPMSFSCAVLVHFLFRCPCPYMFPCPMSFHALCLLTILSLPTTWHALCIQSCSFAGFISVLVRS